MKKYFLVLFGMFVFSGIVLAEGLKEITEREAESGKNWEDDRLFTGVMVKNGDTVLRSGTEVAVDMATLQQSGNISPEGLALLRRDVTMISSGNGDVVYSETHSTGASETTVTQQSNVDSGITLSKRK